MCEGETLGAGEKSKENKWLKIPTTSCSELALSLLFIRDHKEVDFDIQATTDAFYPRLSFLPPCTSG